VVSGAELLAAALDAHGGLGRWRDVAFLTARVRIRGVVWDVKTREHPLREAKVTIEPAVQRTSLTPFGGQGLRSFFTPDLAAVLGADGQVLQVRRHPRAAFAGDTAENPWDELQLAYFTGFTLWNYLTLPFLAAYPGFEIETGLPMDTGQGSWRRLDLTFPSEIATHTPQQAMYFGDDNLLRRLDYDSEIFGGAPASQLMSGYVQVNGFSFPSRRTIVPRTPDGRAESGPVLIGIDLDDFDVITTASDR
jgi:hypothetical protein